MKRGHPALKIYHQKAHSLLGRRYAKRVPIRYRISYSREEGTQIVIEARALNDLSTTGCKILGAASIPLGSRLTLLLDLEDVAGPHVPHQRHGLPACRDSCAVRFPKLSPKERKGLQELIWQRVRVSSLDDRRTAFRIV